LATGLPLTADTRADFVRHLRYDCKGEWAQAHCTAAAIFIVEARRVIFGVDMDYTDKRLVYWDSGESVAYSVKEYWDGLSGYEKSQLNKKMQAWSECQFMKADESDQWYVLGELPEHNVTGWDDRWEFVNAHFTHPAAEAFSSARSTTTATGCGSSSSRSTTPGSSKPSRKRSLRAR
jgi:hypothetical protein